MYKLINSYEDALIASTSQDPTDYNSAWDTQTSSDDIFIQGIKDVFDDVSVLIASFKNGNTLLTTVEVERGETPVYDGDTPTKASTASKTYTFSGWSPSLTNYEMTSNTTFTAQFSEAAREYTITFKDYDETTVLETKQVAYGTTPEYTGEAPTREGYTFTGWTPTLAAVTGDATYVATYTEDTPAEEPTE